MLALYAIAAGQPSKLHLSGNSYWLVIAGRQGLSEAIGAVRNYTYGDKAVKVLRSENGWFAVVAGPERIDDPQSYLQKLKAAPFPKYPNDIRLSRGEKFVEQVWAPRNFEPVATASYEGKKSVSVTFQDIEVRLNSEKISSDSYVATATGLRSGDQIFAMRMPDEHAGDEVSSKVDIVRLDRESARPQVVFTFFSRLLSPPA